MQAGIGGPVRRRRRFPGDVSGPCSPRRFHPRPQSSKWLAPRRRQSDRPSCASAVGQAIRARTAPNCGRRPRGQIPGHSNRGSQGSALGRVEPASLQLPRCRGGVRRGRPNPSRRRPPAWDSSWRLIQSALARPRPTRPTTGSPGGGPWGRTFGFITDDCGCSAPVGLAHSDHCDIGTIARKNHILGNRGFTTHDSNSISPVCAGDRGRARLLHTPPAAKTSSGSGPATCGAGGLAGTAGPET